MNFILELDDEENVSIFIPEGISFEKIKDITNKIQSKEIQVVITRKISLQQTKLIWVLCKELGDLIGYTREGMRELLQEEFCNKNELPYFSISPSKSDCCSKDVATSFILNFQEDSHLFRWEMNWKKFGY